MLARRAEEPGVPVLLLGFNRPEFLRRNLQSLERLGDGIQLYAALDGPRPGRSEDVAAIGHCRELLARSNQTSRDRVLLRERNLGCGRAVSDAITWFFSHVTEGVILEDDCLVSQEFWPFARRALAALRSDSSVGHISATNFVPPELISDVHSLARLSRYPNVWGWATWRDRWEGYKLQCDWSTVRRNLEALPPLERLSWSLMLQSASVGLVDTWDYQWMLHNWAAGRLALSSNINYVQNIGVNQGAHRSKRTRTLETHSISPLDRLQSPLLSSLEVDVRADEWEARYRFDTTLRGTTHRLAATLKLALRRATL